MRIFNDTEHELRPFHWTSWPQYGRMVAMESDNTLNQLSSRELRQQFVEIIGQPPPPKASIHFIKGQIAWTLQARQWGNDPNDLRQAILQKCRNSNSCITQYKPGTRLVREWQGKVYEVTVLQEGYEYGGVSYRSLSQVANVITGSHCSGPRFFGIKKTK